jgi:hypothetical protein
MRASAHLADSPKVTETGAKPNDKKTASHDKKRTAVLLFDGMASARDFD